VIEGRKVVERQRRTVEKLQYSGHTAAGAEQTLEVFERTLVIFEDQLRVLTAELKR
jgi:hypothetical protein